MSKIPAEYSDAEGRIAGYMSGMSAVGDYSVVDAVTNPDIEPVDVTISAQDAWDNATFGERAMHRLDVAGYNTGVGALGGIGSLIKAPEELIGAAGWVVDQARGQESDYVLGEALNEGFEGGVSFLDNIRTASISLQDRIGLDGQVGLDQQHEVGDYVPQAMDRIDFGLQIGGMLGGGYLTGTGLAKGAQSLTSLTNNAFVARGANLLDNIDGSFSLAPLAPMALEGARNWYAGEPDQLREMLLHSDDSMFNTMADMFVEDGLQSGPLHISASVAEEVSPTECIAGYFKDAADQAGLSDSVLESEQNLAEFTQGLLDQNPESLIDCGVSEADRDALHTEFTGWTHENLSQYVM